VWVIHMDKELRRNQSILKISAEGVMLFALWSIIKTVLYCLTKPEAVLETLSFGQDLGGDHEITLVIFLIAAAVMDLIDFALRLYVGTCAVRESRGKKNGIVYLVINIVFIIISISTVFVLCTPISHHLTRDSVIISIIVELTALFAETELLMSAIKVKTIRKKMKAEE